MMKRAHVRPLLIVTLAIFSLSVYLNSAAIAATRTWNKSAGGTYSFTDAANWDDGTTSFPNGVDDIAVMDTLDLTGTQTVSLNQSITLGELHLGDTGGGSGLSFPQNLSNSGGSGALVFQKSSGNAQLTYGNPSVNLRTSLNVNVPVTLNSDTEISLALQSSGSRNLYFNTGALSGSGSMIINSANRGTVAFFTDTYDLSNYTGTVKYTSNGASGNFLQFAGNTVAGGARALHGVTLEMAVATAGGNVCIFDAQDGAIFELGALRGDGLIVPFTNLAGSTVLSGTLKTGYLPGTNNYSGVLSSDARFPGSADPVNFNYEKVGANSTQIFSGNNTYIGTTTVTEGTLLVNGTHTNSLVPIGPYSVASGATLGGTGSISSTVDVSSGGILAPGASIESLDVEGATIGGELAIEYQGSSIDELNVSGSLDITSATVDFTNLGGVLTAGAHVFATYGSLSGASFANVLNLPSGATIDYNFGGTNNQIALIAPVPPSVPGDYNNNGVVDASDYVLWRKGGPLQNEVATIGSVTAEDYTEWRVRFGNPPGSGAGFGTSAVPEPTAGGLILLAGLLMCGTRRVRWALSNCK